MSFKLAIASGKGGTGKTTLSVSLYHYFSRHIPGVQLIDCDVEEPNDALFFSGKEPNSVRPVYQSVPEIDNEKCVYCRKCSEYCEFNAIVVIPPVEFAEVNENLCHSCGACYYACEYEAIHEKEIEIGQVSAFGTEKTRFLLEGKLKIGSAMQTMMIRELKKEADPDAGLLIYDAPPGTSCPVVETLLDADFVILITEPTPFGLHDLKLMTDLMEELHLPFGVVINKSGLGDRESYRFLKEKAIRLLGEIPFSRDYAGSYSRGDLMDSVPPEIRNAYKSISEELNQLIFSR